MHVSDESHEKRAQSIEIINHGKMKARTRLHANYGEEQVTHECVNLNMLTKILLRKFSSLFRVSGI